MTRALSVSGISLLALALVACGSSGHEKTSATQKAFLSAGGVRVSSTQEAALVVRPGGVVQISAPGAASTTVTIRPLVHPGSSVHAYLEALGRGDNVKDPITASLKLEKPTMLWRANLRPNYYELDVGRARLGLAVEPSTRPHLVKLPLLVEGTCQIVALRPVPPPDFVVSSARRMAASLGDSQPDSARYLLSTELLASLGTSGGVPARSCNLPVYLVALAGHFVAKDVPRPPGAKSPRGTVATATYAAGGKDEGGSFGLSSQSYDLGRLGRVGDLMPYLKGKRGTSKPTVVVAVPKP
jgi:hypothetical protein